MRLNRERLDALILLNSSLFEKKKGRKDVDQKVGKFEQPKRAWVLWVPCMSLRNVECFYIA